MAQPAHSRASRSLPWSCFCLHSNPPNGISYRVVGNNSLAFLGFWWIHYHQLINAAHRKLSARSFWRGGETLWPFLTAVSSQMCWSERHWKDRTASWSQSPFSAQFTPEGKLGCLEQLKSPSAPRKLSSDNRITQSHSENIFLHIGKQCKIAE